MLPNINSMGKWARVLVNEIIYGIWDFTAGLKALKIGIGQAPGTELLEIAKDTDVSAIVGRAKIGFNGINSDNAVFGHVDCIAGNTAAVKQSNDGNTVICCASGKSIYLRHTDTTTIGYINQYGLGIGAASAGEKCEVTGAIKTVYVSDTDSDTDDVLSTGITTKFGLVLIKETTANKFCLFRIKGDNSIPIIIDGDAEFTVTKATASSYNFYYETDQFKLQNKVGDNKALYVGLYLV